MINKFFKSKKVLNQLFGGLLIISLLSSPLFMPVSALANSDTIDDGGATSTEPIIIDDTNDGPEEELPPPPPENTVLEETVASTTDNDNGTTTASSSTPDIEPFSVTPGPEDDSNDTSSTTATSTTEELPGPQNGADGTEGPVGTPGQAAESITENLSDNYKPVATSSDALIGDSTDTAPGEPGKDDTENTGEVIKDGGNITIETATATAKAELFTDANSNDVRSQLTPQAASGDLDLYTFNATGTNEGISENKGKSEAITGENTAIAANSARIKTGAAVAVFNVANIINTSVVNSDGIIYLGNKILKGGESLDLTSNFFPDPEKHKLGKNVCDLMSCAAEDIVYNFSQENTADIKNDIDVTALTGKNLADGYNTISDIETGDAFAGANVMNVANTNIVDSNYQLLTFNAIGDLDGDLILPTEDLFMAYFAQPNGVNQVEHARDAKLSVNNTNIADDVTNNLNSYGDTGKNEATTSLDSNIQTGMAHTESNILNKINENSFGGDIFELRIRIHGVWDGEVVGLPAGLSWEYTDDGIRIYNENAEIAASPNLGYDIDSYNANITDRNEVTLQNNLNLSAITGQNEVLGLYGNIKTGDAFASANVMNIANTNVIGANWTYAVVNILGDLKGNISFAAPTNLSLSGSVTSETNPLAPGTPLTYKYTVTNNSSVPALDVSIEQTLINAFANGTETEQNKSVGDIEPHGTRQIEFSATIDPALEVGTSSVIAHATVRTQSGGDTDFNDNVLILQNDFHYSTSTTTEDPGGDQGTDDDTASTTPEDENVVVPPPVNNPVVTSGGGGGGGGGGGFSSSEYTKTDMKRDAVDVDPNKPPLITITKTAKVGKSSTIKAGDSVDYVITVNNRGGQAYDATVYDVLSNPIGAKLNSQDWELGTIKAGEEIKLTYTTKYDQNTPSGIYSNTASIVAYAKPGMKKANQDPLKIKDAVYELKIKGVPLAVGNVGVLAYFPGSFGQVSALLSWETSSSSVSQLVYGPLLPETSYNPNKPNYGYDHASFRFPTPKTRHLMIIMGLKPGQSYAYRAHATSNSDTTTSREYAFRVPPAITTLTLATPSDNLLSPQPQVAGATASAQASKPKN